MKVFVSYADADADLGKRVGDALRASGFQAWDISLVFPGDNLGTELGEALEESNAMVVLLTPNALRSPNVTLEIGFALVNKSYKGRVIPVVATPPEQLPKEEISWILNRFQMVQLPEVDQDGEGIQRIAKAQQAAA